MAEVPLDAAAANRFISSLSKSLQALCHGCMDFDSGIEIGGYIYVSIDSGNKVDYVLNEMVKKSDNNSMRFISNSYLSKRDKQILTRDGSCSPVPELQSPRKNVYQNQGNFHHRSSYPYSSHVLRGAQKRAWGGMDRVPRKHSRIQRSSFPQNQPYNDSASFTSMPTNQNIPSVPSSAASSYHQPQVSGDGELSEDIRIKQEMLNSDDQSTSNNGANESEQLTNSNNVSEEGKVNIKSDPDSITNENDDLNHEHSNEQSDQFLQQSMNSQQLETGESVSQLEGQFPTMDPTATSQSSTDVPLRSEEQMHEHFENSLPVQFDQTGSDLVYGQSSYPEQGEQASGDGTGFDVIEIDDEDEDMQAMFGDNRKYILFICRN